MKKFAIGLTVAALAVGGAAYAADPEGRFNPDSNRDGVVTRAESQAEATAMFARLDANNDGRLDQTDRDALHQQMRTTMFDKLDADKDGAITRDEFIAFEGPGKGEPGMGGPMDEHGRMGMGMGGHGKMMMEKADADNDGAVSKAEFTAAADQRFDSIDTNHDGQITETERQAHRQQMRAKWHDRTDG